MGIFARTASFAALRHELRAVHRRHVPVEEEDERRCLVGTKVVERLLTVLGFHLVSAKPSSASVSRVASPDIRIIVDEEDWAATIRPHGRPRRQIHVPWGAGR